MLHVFDYVCLVFGEEETTFAEQKEYQNVLILAETHFTHGTGDAIASSYLAVNRAAIWTSERRATATELGLWCKS